MGKFDPATTGGRVRTLRIERDLSQAELAAAFPGKRTQAWVSSVETGRQQLANEYAAPLAAILGVTEAYLLTGDRGGDSSFIAKMRGLEPLLDERAQRAVVVLAEQQAQESERREAAMRRLLADPEIQARYEELLAEEVASRAETVAASA